MLLDLKQLYKKYNMRIYGLLHVGANECEELPMYNSIGIPNSSIYWVEALDYKIKYCIDNNDISLNIYQAVITEKDGDKVNFHIANKHMYSSCLNIHYLSKHYPNVNYIGDKVLLTKRLDTLITERNIPINSINFLKINICGSELKALKSMENLLIKIDYIYARVYTEEVYENCPVIDDIDKYLKQHFFKRVKTKIWCNCGWGEALYIRTLFSTPSMLISE